MRISDWSSDVCSSDLDDELHRAREPMVERFRQSLKTNRGWYGMMLAAAYSPETINDALTEVEVVQGVTPARLQELARQCLVPDKRSEEHTSELQSLMRISYAVFCLKKKK